VGGEPALVFRHKLGDVVGNELGGTINTFDWDATNGGTLYHCNAAMGGSDSGSTYIPANSSLPSFYQEEGGLFSPGASSFELKHSTVKMMLHTGGKSGVGKQGLFQLTAGATVEMPVPSTGYYHQAYIVDGPGIPYDQITVDGQKLGSDGIVWKVYPDGATIDVTPQANAPLYRFTVDQSKYTPVIQINNSVTLDFDDVAPGADYCVGQYLTFALSGIPVSTSDYQWTLDGHFFNAQTNFCPTGSMDPYVIPGLLTSNETTAWWVSGGPDANTPATYTASTSFILNFQNGQSSIPLSVDGTFHMYRPTATISPVTSTVNLEYLTLETVTPEPYLIFGDYFSGSGIPGIVFLNTINYPTKFHGSIEWIQVVLNQEVNLLDIWGTNHTLVHANSTPPYLDTSDPYETFYDVDIPDDSPGQVMGSDIIQADLSESFEMTMMFNPPGGGVRVPIRAVDWSWNGLGTVESGGATGSGSPDGPDLPTEKYPQWNSNVGDTTWNPPLP
jgi:hypothetical protein